MQAFVDAPNRANHLNNEAAAVLGAMIRSSVRPNIRPHVINLFLISIIFRMGPLAQINQKSNIRKPVCLQPVLVLEESSANTKKTNTKMIKSVCGKMASKTVTMRANLLFHLQIRLFDLKLRTIMLGDYPGCSNTITR